MVGKGRGFMEQGQGDFPKFTLKFPQKFLHSLFHMNRSEFAECIFGGGVRSLDGFFRIRWFYCWDVFGLDYCTQVVPWHFCLF